MYQLRNFPFLCLLPRALKLQSLAPCSPVSFWWAVINSPWAGGFAAAREGRENGFPNLFPHQYWGD